MWVTWFLTGYRFHYNEAIALCAEAGDVERAFEFYRQASGKGALDAWVFTSLITACSQAVEKMASQIRRTQATPSPPPVVCLPL